ncbi:MAG: hypothetical protein EXR74_04360 [Bdellovibrionales bacterium]|nr:hypothetical protein [Bdellovibrionales bacterium]
MTGYSPNKHFDLKHPYSGFQLRKKLCVSLYFLLLLSFGLISTAIANPATESIKNPRVDGMHRSTIHLDYAAPQFFVMSMTQSGLTAEKSSQIDDLKKRMREGTFEFNDNRQVSGLYHERSDTYFVSEGHHRLAAALEIAKEDGDWSFFKKLVQKGYWDKTDTVPQNRYRIKMRSSWSNFMGCRLLLSRLVPTRGNLFVR